MDLDEGEYTLHRNTVQNKEATGQSETEERDNSDDLIEIEEGDIELVET